MTSDWKRSGRLGQVEARRHLRARPCSRRRRAGRRSRASASATSGSSGQAVVVEPRGDAEVGELGRSRRRQLQPPRRVVPAVGAAHQVERQLQVGDGAGHRPGDGDVGLGQRARRAGDLAVRRHDAVARLVAVDAGHVGRQADRAADVGADLQRGEPCRQRRRRAARRAARRALEVPRVVGRAEHLVVALEVAGVDRQVGLAPDHRTGARAARRRARRPPSGTCVGQLRRTRRGAHPGRGEAVLDGHRHAVQRPGRLAVASSPGRPRRPRRTPRRGRW